MNNPFQEPAPDDVIERVHALARDLAYGATQGLWHTQINWQMLMIPESSKISQVMAETLGPKWQRDFPAEFLLLSFGYLTPHGQIAGYSNYLLTEKAFALLEQPTIAPDVFISYRRSDSSAFGLLIEARLKLAGHPNPFIDKNLVAGEEWSRELEERIRSSRYFVLLIGPHTLASPHVQQELEWAWQAGCTIVSIWHGCELDDDTPDILRNRHAIHVDVESALGYEMAINQLLNSLGYRTY